MAPRKRAANELNRFLVATKDSAVREWLAGVHAKPSLWKTLSRQVGRGRCPDLLADVYDALIPSLSTPTATGATRKVRLKKASNTCMRDLALRDTQQSLLILLEVLTRAARRTHKKNPRKAEKFAGQLTDRIHDVMLRVAAADDTGRKRTAGRFESKYARLLDMANDAILLLDFESGIFVEANKAACELTGYSEAELKQMGINSLTSVFDLNLAIEKTTAAIEKGAIRFDDLSIYTKKGAVVPVDISASAVTIDGAKHILAILRDIKERKAFEKNIQEKAERLKLMHEIGRAISSAGLDIEAVLSTILEAVARVIRVEAGSVLKREDDELAFMAALGEKADSVKPFRLKVGQGIAGWVAKTGEGVVIRDVHKDPRYYPGIEKATGFVSKSILAVPMKTQDKVVGVIELINKIGGQFSRKDLQFIAAISSFAAVALEHARLYAACEIARAHLLQMHIPVSSSRLAAVVAQEMKDPLGIVKNYVRILSNKLSSLGAESEELEVISDEVTRIANITDQLLHFSETYGDEPRETPLNLLIENSIDSMRERLNEAGIATELNLEKPLPHISVVPNQFKMVFSNLIRLSMTEMPDGGTLTVSTQRKNSAICVEFSNTGTKHTKEEAGELFQPSAVAKGLVPKGLGLYMVYNIVRGCGGDIEVKARRGRGNTFRITLPIETAGPSGGVSA
jgi:PAS domain S-box-containing protein